MINKILISILLFFIFSCNNEKIKDSPVQKLSTLSSIKTLTINQKTIIGLPTCSSKQILIDLEIDNTTLDTIKLHKQGDINICGFYVGKMNHKHTLCFEMDTATRNIWLPDLNPDIPIPDDWVSDYNNVDLGLVITNLQEDYLLYPNHKKTLNCMLLLPKTYGMSLEDTYKDYEKGFASTFKITNKNLTDSKNIGIFTKAEDFKVIFKLDGKTVDRKNTTNMRVSEYSSCIEPSN